MVLHMRKRGTGVIAILASGLLLQASPAHAGWIEADKTAFDYGWLIIAGILVAAMQIGFLFLEAGTVRSKNSINVAMKNLVDFVISALCFALIGFSLMFGASQAGIIGWDHGLAMLRFNDLPTETFFFFQVMFCGTASTIVSGAVAERMRFGAYMVCTILLASFIYPVAGHWAWGSLLADTGQGWLEAMGFIDFAGSTVVHVIGGAAAFAMLIPLGPRIGRFAKDGTAIRIQGHSPILTVAGVLILWIGWFGFNVMSAQSTAGVSGLVALNSLLAMVGGIVAATILGKSDPGFVHNGALAGLVAVCAGSDVMHPIGALVVGAVAGAIFVKGFIVTQERLKVDDVLGVWPLHGLCGLWGGIACGIFGLEALGGMGGVSPLVQILGSLLVSAYALAAGAIIYAIVKRTVGLRLTDEQQRRGADLSIHSIGAEPEV